MQTVCLVLICVMFVLGMAASWWCRQTGRDNKLLTISYLVLSVAMASMAIQDAGRHRASWVLSAAGAVYFLIVWMRNTHIITKLLHSTRHPPIP